MPFSTAGGAGSEALLAAEPPPLAGEAGPIKFPAHVERSSSQQAIEMDDLGGETPRSDSDSGGGGGRARSPSGVLSRLSVRSPRLGVSDIDPATKSEAFMLKFSRMTTHLANERTLLAWLRTSAAFFSIGLSFAKIDLIQDDIVATAFVLVAILTFIVGLVRYYQVKTVLETKDTDFQVAQGFNRLGAGRMLAAAVVAFSIAALVLLWSTLSEIGSSGTRNGESYAPTPAPLVGGAAGADEQLDVLKQILAALEAQGGAAAGAGAG